MSSKEMDMAWLTRQAEERERVAIDTLRRLVEALGAWHVELMSYYSEWNHRRGFLNEINGRFWENPELNLSATNPESVAKVKAELATFPLQPTLTPV